MVFFIKYLDCLNKYICLFFGPSHREVMNTKILPQIWYLVDNSVYYVSHLVANYELNILMLESTSTLAASSSPMKSPSLILMGPKVTY